ncbi:hypothetical protein Hanom_Chr12g01143141 [Helianthus anomalus]
MGNVKIGRVNEHIWIAPHKFLRFKTAELEFQNRFEILQARHEEPPRHVCYDTLDAVGQRERYDALVTGPLRIYLETRLWSIHKYNLEFLRTLKYKRTEPDLFYSDAVEFRCGAVWYSFSVAQFGVHFGLYTEEDAAKAEFTKALRELPDNFRHAAWALIGVGHYNPTSTKSTKIRDPLIRYIHRVLSSSLCQMDNSGGMVNLRELTILYCLVTHQPINVPHLAPKHGLQCYQGHPNADFLRGMDRKVVQKNHSTNPIVVLQRCRYHQGRSCNLP